MHLIDDRMTTTIVCDAKGGGQIVLMVDILCGRFSSSVWLFLLYIGTSIIKNTN
jgi:hypothetical protein